jgi:hypothetical protein
VEAISASLSEQLVDQIPLQRSASCTVDYGGTRPTMRVWGCPDRAMVREISGLIRGLHAVGVRHLAVDLSAAVDCNRQLLTVLARAHARWADGSGVLWITGVKLPQFLYALQSASVDEVFLIYGAVRRDSAVSTRARPRRGVWPGWGP